ncbi:Oidioi.mRNA.OKI2018_I69.chr2.g5554.t1.cds [Oikopleura dioica]|uniref:Oidioi.mRNA.OKI2018_I69.chr2.g5554.t1.cds n=1 Tax=Oikopleura dioica TaxID=34765 RepID=A0ABN7T791_OIKDI|nr:Oidioi.mRNA.OKI2018_I69.chr2.g5554.t1.cds [Oikopleura dioica]
MSTLGLYFEDKPLRQGTKRALGPADRYPQDQFQKEDELSATFLKHGFSLLNPLVSQPNESSSAKDVFTQKFIEKSEEDETLMPNFYEKRVLKSLKQIQDDSLRCSQIQDDFKNEKKKFQSQKKVSESSNLGSPLIKIATET